MGPVKVRIFGCWTPRAPAGHEELQPPPGGGQMTGMNTTIIRWSPNEMSTVVAALDAGAAPVLDPRIAAEVREASARGSLDLGYADAQQLMRWCEARRERASEQQPDAAWTRIVAIIHEAVQVAAPAREAQPAQPSR